MTGIVRSLINFGRRFFLAIRPVPVATPAPPRRPGTTLLLLAATLVTCGCHHQPPAEPRDSTLLERAESARAAGDFQAAIADYQRLLRRNPEHREALAGMVVCCWHTDHHLLGLSYIDRLEKLGHNEPEIQKYKRRLLQAIGDHRAFLPERAIAKPKHPAGAAVP